LQKAENYPLQQRWRAVKCSWNESVGTTQFQELCERFHDSYPTFIAELRKKRDHYLSFLKYPDAIRRSLPTTNAVEAVNGLLEINFSRSGVTTDEGSYLIPQLPIGPNYQITAEVEGFKTFVRTGVALQLKQNAHVDMQLEVGTSTQNVEVKAQAPLVDTESATGGEVVGTDRLRELPLNGRNPIQLAGLITGVSGLNALETLSNGNRSASSLSANGSRANDVDWQLNGIRFAGSYFNRGLNYPNPDALSEFKLITNPNSAELGAYSGALFTAVMKSGTNQFHGDLFEFFRNTHLNARPFFASGITPYHRNQFGGTFGGPVVENRLFFFGSYQGLRIREQILDVSYPLSTDERNGLCEARLP
jgi:hypothetical protein